MINVIAPGSTVKIGSKHEIKGMVTAICVRGKEFNLSYEVAWWDGQTRISKWLESIEIEFDEYNVAQYKIGFRAKNNDKEDE